MNKLIFLFLFLSINLYGQKTPGQALEADYDQQALSSIPELMDFLSIPNDAQYPEHIEENINWLKSAFDKRGFKVKDLKVQGATFLLAERKSQDAQNTVLFYMHFDGQPVDTSRWFQESPYQPVFKARSGDKWQKVEVESYDEVKADWRIFGRSASDDKGPIIMMLAALDLLEARNNQIPYNVKVILDSEEEIGSPHLFEAVQKYRDELSADRLVVFDGPIHDSGRPTLVYGVRGIATATLTVFGPRLPQHSGHFGNYAPNPAFRLAELLASMKDEDGRVTIPGYYDGIELSDDISKVLNSVPDEEHALYKRIGIAEHEKVGSNYQESVQYPSLNVRGMQSGWVGDKVRTIVPSEAIAEIDVRLVLESDHQKLFQLIRKHIENEGYTVLDSNPSEEQRLSVDKLVKFETNEAVMLPFRTDIDSDIGEWLRTALSSGYNEEIVQIRTHGGSVPIAFFINELNTPAVLVPLVNPDNNQHSPNENLRFGHYRNGIKSCYLILSTP